jgi:hypothetical protein
MGVVWSRAWCDAALLLLQALLQSGHVLDDKKEEVDVGRITSLILGLE